MKRLSTILFPTDFSSLSDAALEQAAAIALENDARLLIVHIEEPPMTYAEGHFYYGLPDPDRDALRRMLNEIRPANPAVRVERHFLQGNPADEIVALAKRERADLIVMSSHGRSGLRRLIMGSVAEGVMRGAECSILIYKPKAAEPAPTAGAVK